MGANTYSYDFSRRPENIERVVFQILRTDPAQLPACMRRLFFRCDDCELTDPTTCLMARDPDFVSYLKFFIENELHVRNLIRRVIKEHGRPMYWDIIAAMVEHRYPRVSKRLVYLLLSAYPGDFASFDVGVYGLAEWKDEPRPD